jgi:hypothetical protein
MILLCTRVAPKVMPPIIFHGNYHSRRLRMTSGATAPSPALEGAPRFRPKVVLMSLSLVMLIHALFEIFFNVKFRSVILHWRTGGWGG